MNLFRTLVVCADQRVARSLQKVAADLEFAMSGVATLDAARPALEDDAVDLVILDLAIERGRGIDLVVGIRHAFPDLPLLLITDPQLRDYDRAAMKIGVDGFIVRPVRQEHVRFQIAQVREMRRLRQEYARLKEESRAPETFEGIVGASSPMRRVFQLVTRAAASSVPVAVYGESGTGKELVARAIHRVSARAAGPFVAVNPSSIPESLLEGELFGYVRGAFTGAVAERVGYVEAAAGGTLFLDEIGDLPLAVQGKFLRVLQEKSLQRIGSSRPVACDFRLVTATNRDLMSDVHARRFREDLFYRIHVFPIYLPPLRARRTDIALLAEQFLRKYARELNRAALALAPGVLDRLMQHAWPGNVRELENVIYRLVASRPDADVVEPEDLVGLIEESGHAPSAAAPDVSSLLEVRPLREHESEYVAWAYRKLGRNKAKTARVLEIDRTTLYRKLRESGSGRTTGT